MSVFYLSLTVTVKQMSTADSQKMERGKPKHTTKDDPIIKSQRKTAKEGEGTRKIGNNKIALESPYQSVITAL